LDSLQTKEKVNQKIEMKLVEQGFEESNAYSLCLYAFRSPITKDFFWNQYHTGDL